MTTNDPDLRNPSGQGGLTVEVTGGENHFTIFTVRESPLDPALVWVGTDDGNVQITRNGGATWTNVRDNLPGVAGEVWVSRVEPSHHDIARAYVVLDNHRLDDMDPHVFVTDDLGATFRDITGNLPHGIGSYVINEDPVNPALLFVGTEYGVYASIERGLNWFKLSSGMPNVAVRDLLIHPRDGDLVAGTHGRSIWILDDITPLRQMTRAVQSTDAHLFHNRTATKWVSIDLGRKQPDFLFRGQNPPAGALIDFWLREAPAGEVTLEVSELNGDRAAAVRPRDGGGFRGGRGGLRGGRGGGDGASAHAGINRALWDFRFPSTEAERAAVNARLVDAIGFLEAHVIEEGKRQQLTRLRLQLAEADSDAALNRVRNELAGDFNAYAEGRVLFGPQIAGTMAEAGIYRVTLTVAGQTYQGSVTVREDPLMAEHGSR